MKAITGCFRTTPTAALEMETGLTPPELRLQYKVKRLITRMQILSRSHSLTEWTQKAIKNKATTIFTSNLENWASKFPEYTTSTETIYPFIQPPWAVTPIQYCIKPTKDQAKAYHDTILPELVADPETISIYTDGSGIESRIEAAAYSPTIEEAKQQYLGQESQSNVFAAELTAICMAIQITRQHRQYTKCVIFTDSQAAIKSK